MPSFFKSRLFTWGAGAIVGLAVLIGGLFWYQDKSKHEATDNAFVQADTVQVSPQISGYVVQVLVEDNQPVVAGQVLAVLDQAPVQARLDAAIANVAAMEAAVRAVDDRGSTEQAVIAQRIAAIASAEAAAAAQKADADRYAALQAQGIVSPQRVQAATATAQQGQAAVTQARAALEAERRTAGSMGSAREQALAQVQAARAAVAQARIDLDRTTIRAPIAGVVGAKAVRVGQQVQAGLTLLAIVPVEQTYVVANFKETQLGRLRIGQPVAIHADAYGDRVIRGRIDSFAPATGSEFALIPVENAVGNFTKITQRVPVKITVLPGELAGSLRPGLSVSVTVDITQNTGPTFAEAGASPRVTARAAPAASPPASAPQAR
ncbi:MAG: HlyD family secretion protein [Caulobacteraceae bacterium]